MTSIKLVDPTRVGLLRIRQTLTFYGVGLGLLALFLLFANGSCRRGCGEATAFSIAVIALGALSALSVWVVLRLVRCDPQTLWTPAVLFPLSTLIFFGFGSASTLFADPATMQFLQSGSYGLDATGLIRAHLLTVAGATIAVALMVFAMRLRFGSSGMPHDAGKTKQRLSLPVTASIFIIFGAVLKYCLILPSQWGIIGVSVPGSVVNLSHLLDIGLSIAMYLAVRGSQPWWAIFLVIWPLHLVVSLLEFSKSVMLLAILLPAAGAFLAHKSWKRLLPWLVFAVISYQALQDINTTARVTFLQTIGNFREAGYMARADLLQRILTGDLTLMEVTSVAQVDAQVAWLRLNYSGVQLQAMELYDSGSPSDSSLQIVAAIVPRILWPEKPNMTLTGRDFNRVVTGRYDATTRVGMTVYADGYWVMGWSGLILYSAIMGAILGFMTRISYRYVVRRQLVYLPVVFLAMRSAALGPVGFLQTSFIGALPILLALMGIIYLLEKSLSGLQREDTVSSHPLQ